MKTEEIKLVCDIMPTLEYLSRPITVEGKKITTTELAIFGRMVFVALANKEKVNKEFARQFLKEKILIYTNPENVDFGEQQ